MTRDFRLRWILENCRSTSAPRWRRAIAGMIKKKISRIRNGSEPRRSSMLKPSYFRAVRRRISAVLFVDIQEIRLEQDRRRNFRNHIALRIGGARLNVPAM